MFFRNFNVTWMFPFVVCRSCVGRNPILFTKCKKQMHHKCTNTKSFSQGSTAHQLPPSPIMQQHLHLSNIHLEQVVKFCYLDDMIIYNGGCMDAMNARISSRWKKFHQLLLILSNHWTSFERCGYVYISSLYNVILYASEKWSMATEMLTRLVRYKQELNVKLVSTYKMSFY